MASLWTFVGSTRNRQIISWLGGGVIAVAAGGWAVVTYVWPAHESPVVCAQGGSIAAGRDASGNTINYNGRGPAVAATGAASCANAAK